MAKSVFSREYREFLRQLRRARERSGLTQAELAKALGQTQSFVSKCERGERRVDIVELRHMCAAIGLSIEDFVRRLDQEIRVK